MKTRRVGLLISVVGMNLALLLSPVTTERVVARGCTQYCDEDVVACNENCSLLYEDHSDDWYICRSACASDWQFCYTYSSVCSFWCVDNSCHTQYVCFSASNPHGLDTICTAGSQCWCPTP